MTNLQSGSFTRLTRKQIEQLELQGCLSSDWSGIEISINTDLAKIRNVRLEGDFIIGDNVVIENVGILQFHKGANCGVGAEIDVLDETGSRSVTIYPGLSAQMALLMCRVPKWKFGKGEKVIRKHISSLGEESKKFVGDSAIIRNCGSVIDVCVGKGCVVEGASYLRNGMIVNNSPDISAHPRIGAGVNAENFIMEDACVDSGAIIRNCYIGQGCRIEKGFSAHDSLFFANCAMENGEACALFAGPYTVSMHKSSLLIGCQTSFMNAGSGTNQSNHMYKLGPVHWGILERGVKTSSGSYLMLGAKIGAFSLLMGQHKTHPDSSQFPFSYLFGDDRGATVVVPGAMLRSCGLMRDQKKWSARDRRLEHALPLHDRIIFGILNPLTVNTILDAIDVIKNLLIQPADDDLYLRYRGMKFTRASLERAVYLYKLAIYKYLNHQLGKMGFPPRPDEVKEMEWLDMAGLIMPRSYLDKAMDQGSVAEVENVFDTAVEHYPNLQRAWIATRFSEEWHKPAEVIAEYAAEFDRLSEEDREKALEDIDAMNRMLEL